MIFSTVFMWLLIAVGFIVALPALWLLSRGLWPAMAANHREAASRGLLVCFLLGLIPLVGGTVVIAIISKLPKMGVLSVLVGGLMLAWGFLGAGGIATLIGERLWSTLPSHETWRQTMRGGVVLICCSLLPVVGWFFLLPLMAIIGWGINVRALFLRQHAAAPAPVLSPGPAMPPPLNTDSVSA